MRLGFWSNYSTGTSAANKLYNWRWYRGKVFAANGPREVARRKRQIKHGQLAFTHVTPKGAMYLAVRRDGKLVRLSQ